jgi:hypothetical protein
LTTPVNRPDEVKAARSPILRWMPEKASAPVEAGATA